MAVLQIDSIIADAALEGNTKGIDVAFIDSTHVIVAHGALNSDGFVKIFSFDGSFDNLTLIDTDEFDTTLAQNISIINLDDTNFVIAYRGGGSSFPSLAHISIDGSYVITVESTTTHDTFTGALQWHRAIKLDSTHFAVCYKGTGNDGFLKTFSLISGTFAELDVEEFDTITATQMDIDAFTSKRLVIASRGAGQDGFVRTFTLDGSWQITEVDEHEFETVAMADAGRCGVAVIDATHFAIAYGAGSRTAPTSVVETFSVDSGLNNITLIDSIDTTTLGEYHDLILIDTNRLVHAFSGPDDDGFVRAISLDGSYNLTVTETLEHDTAFAAWAGLAGIDATHFALFYDAGSQNAVLRTFSIPAIGAPAFIPWISIY